MLENLLSKPAKIILNVLTITTILVAVYFDYLGRGPLQWVASWIADANGRYSVMLAWALALTPILLVECGPVYLGDRLLKRT